MAHSTDPRNVDITDFVDDLLPTLLVSPGRVSIEAIARAANIAPEDIASVSCTKDPLPFSVRACFEPFPHGPTILAENDALTALLSESA